MAVRIFKTKWMARYARRERIADHSLREAIERAGRGTIARSGQGRSGGYRMLIAYRAGTRAVFLYAFAKNERENIDPDELLTLREIGATWLAANEKRIAQALEAGILQEVTNDEEENAT
jgi:hypothetical protein